EHVTLVIHSKVGNGKSVFGSQLKIKLTQQGYQCFSLRNDITPLPQDIEYLKDLSAPVVFFPHYDSAVTNIHLFAGIAKFVVE
ncbi:hypothetical protein, partial [Cereibacter changlensis]